MAQGTYRVNLGIIHRIRCVEFCIKSFSIDSSFSKPIFLSSLLFDRATGIFSCLHGSRFDPVGESQEARDQVKLSKFLVAGFFILARLPLSVTSISRQVAPSYRSNEFRQSLTFSRNRLRSHFRSLDHHSFRLWKPSISSLSELLDKLLFLRHLEAS